MTKSKVKAQISRSNIYIFKIELQTSVIPLCHLILTEKKHFWYYFNDSSLSSRSKGQIQGQIVDIFNKHNQEQI